MLKRILTLLLAVMLGAATPAGAEEYFMPNATPIPDPMIEIPAEYKRPAEQRGTLVRLEYDTWEFFTYESHSQRLNKVAWVYLPYGYDEDTPYNIFYISHGGWSNVYAERLTEAGYVTLVFDGSCFGESEGAPRQQELPDVKQSDIEGAVDFLCGLPYVDSERIGGLGICGSGSYMSVAGVKEPRLKAITTIVPAISDISKSAMVGFFAPAEQVSAAKAAWEAGDGELMHLNLMPLAFDEGAAYYYTSRGTHPAGATA